MIIGKIIKDSFFFASSCIIFKCGGTTQDKNITKWVIQPQLLYYWSAFFFYIVALVVSTNKMVQREEIGHNPGAFSFLQSPFESTRLSCKLCKTRWKKKEKKKAQDNSKVTKPNFTLQMKN